VSDTVEELIADLLFVFMGDDSKVRGKGRTRKGGSGERGNGRQEGDGKLGPQGNFQKSPAMMTTMTKCISAVHQL